MTEKLEQVVGEKVKPLIKKAMHEHLGVTIEEVEQDITDLLSKGRRIAIPSITTPYKQAKKQFKKEYLKQLLHEHHGNVQKASKNANVDRRTIHRLLSEFSINPEQFRTGQLRKDYTRAAEVQDIIEKTLEQYEEALNPSNVSTFYQEAPALSRQIIRELPEERLTLNDAEHIFEKEYFEEALQANDWNVRHAAKNIGIAEETLHRKIKELNITRREKS